MKYAILVHGLSTKYTDSSSLDNLSSTLEDMGYTPIHFRYGFLGPVEAHLNKDISLMLSSMTSRMLGRGDKVCLLGFSNGCAIIDLALQRVSCVHEVQCVYISPVLPRDLYVPECVSKMIVFSNPTDCLIRALSFLRKLSTPFLKTRNWGDAAIHGYSGTNPRVVNITLLEGSWSPILQHNSGLREGGNLHVVISQIRSLIN